MAILDILTYPDKRLRNVAKSVTKFDAKLRAISQNMAATMYAAPGIGLAAIQVNINNRIVVIDISEKKDDLLVLINPTIIKQDGLVETEEGCLSVPDTFAEIERAEIITASAFDLEGKPFTLEAEGMLAICIQHEIDHLNGKVFVDYLSRLKQVRIRKKFVKEMAANAA